MSALLIIITAIALATWAAWELWRLPILRSIFRHDSPSRQYISQQVRYQAVLLLLALAVATLANVLAVPGAVQVFSIGMIGAPASVEFFGVALEAGINWLQAGCMLTLVFGVATMVLVSVSSPGAGTLTGACKTHGGWIIAVSAANALSEELIYRVAVVLVAQGRLEPTATALLSAVLFALAHVRGQASGFAVIAGSTIAGWSFAQAVQQTHGLFWAWWLHFTQDVIIFASIVAQQEYVACQKKAA